ncbi:vWA domain-containing protein [Chachezhania sediminis]|uniref:vWA domain-containing protein n=1 Tax=Chachezhania sediminis TaxID=2599291 RepID=UPI00131C7FA8|nr:VWA domain-containing protein [Chachezhania sediminis]
MTDFVPLPLPENPRLAANVVHFARALRRAGLPVGSGRVTDAIRAVAAAGFTRADDFYWTLHACLVSRPEETQIFARIFRLFWRDPKFLEQMMAALRPMADAAPGDTPEAGRRRAAEALLDGLTPDAPPRDRATEQEVEVDAQGSMSATERLKTLDFDQMSAAEMADARRMLATLTLPARPLPARRGLRDPQGSRIDARASFRRALRTGGELHRLERRAPGLRAPDLVVLCDISGSMSRYSRTVLHFVHAVANRRGAGWGQVHAFTFGTRLTNITRALARRDVDAALAAAGAEARDWEGGTRIGASLRAFNRDWSRRVLGQGALVLLITDGLDRGDPALLTAETERLQRSCRRLVWINPLLRWSGFAPKARGVAAMLPYVDSFRAGHSIAALEELAAVLSAPDDQGEKRRLMAATGR